MPFHRRFILLLLQAIVIISVMGPVTAQAQAAVANVMVDATLQQSGKLLITQTVTFASPSTLRWPIYGRPSELTITANEVPSPVTDFQTRRIGDRYEVTSGERASRWTIKYFSSSQLIRSTERDQIYLPILKEFGTAVGGLELRFHLPSEATGEGLSGNVYAIGGIGRTTVTTSDTQNFIATVTQIGPNAVVTLSAHWPKTVLRLSPGQEIRLALSNLEIVPWLVIGVLLPIFALLALARLLVRQRRQETTERTTQTSPPSDLSPLLVGTLVEKKVYPREIAAMIIDLCCRGYVVIVKKSGQYYLSQRKPFDTGLEPWEQSILEALFPIANTKITAEKLRTLNRQSLFNPKIRTAFQAIYDVITTKQYFLENPHRTRVRYKLGALTLYFAGVVGAMWVAVVGASAYLLLPIAGTLVMCRLIIAYTPGLVRYTPTGRQARAAWLSFGDYLATPAALPLELSRNHAFERYLGYAVALNKTKAWAKRFDLSNIVIVKPDWYVSYEETSTTEFAGEIEEFNRTLSLLLTEMRGPIVS